MTIDLDITFVIVLALFLVPLALLNGIVFRPFLELFEERHERLEGALERADNMLELAGREADAFEQRIKEAAATGLERRNQIRSEAVEQMDAELEAVRKKTQGQMASAMLELEKKRREALADVVVEAERIGELTASKLLGRSLS